MKSFLMIGGDQRFDYLAQLLLNEKHTVYWYQRRSDINPIDGIKIIQHIIETDYTIFPIPMKATDSIDYSHIISRLNTATTVFGGMISNDYADQLTKKHINYFDYGVTEEFALRNAIPTAEGAIEIAMHNTRKTLANSNVCVVGYGRIGKALSQRLKNLGCHVTISARKEKDIHAILENDMQPVYTDELRKCGVFDIIFNTVPAQVIDRSTLIKQTADTLIIDLASKPGGVDLGTAMEREIKVIHALSLPSRCAPDTAGRIIFDIINNQINKGV